MAIGGSANGRHTDSESVNLGSNPSPPAHWYDTSAEVVHHRAV